MQKIFWLILFLAGCLWCNGCIDKTFFPKAELAVSSVTPYYVGWEKSGEGASATYSLPGVKISLQNYTGISAELQSTFVEYRTKLGEIITNLPIYTRKQEIKLEPNATTEFDVAFYYQDLIDLSVSTKSSIFPIKTTILLSIKDQNGNDQTVEANCLILSPDLEIANSAPTTTQTPTTPTNPTNPTTPTTPTTPVEPTLEIILPIANRSFSRNSQVSFVASANPSSPVSGITWTSIPAAIFFPPNNLVSSATFLATGPHTIFLSATVSGRQLSDTVRINITQ